MFGIDDAIVGAVGGALTSGLFGMASASQQSDAAEEAADVANANASAASLAAYNRSVDSYAHRYRWTMADMREAGLNPILAASRGFDVGSGPTVAPAQTFQPSVIPSYASSARDVGELFKSGAEAISQASQAERNEAEVEKIGAETEKLAQDIVESVERVYKIRAEANLVTAQETETVQKIQESVQRIEVLKMQVFELAQRVRTGVSEESLNYAKRSLTDEEARTQGSVRSQLGAAAGKLSQETKNLKLESTELQATSDMYQMSGSGMKYLEKIGRIISLPGLLIYGGRGRKGVK